MHLELMRDSAAKFPSTFDTGNVQSARIWNCKYKSLQGLEMLENLEILVIASFPEKSFEILATLGKLKYLSVLHLPKVTSLEPLRALKRLESLSLATSPAWDAKGQLTTVASLEPIACLPALQHLELFGVCPPTRSPLELLAGCAVLRSARFSKYEPEEVEAFYKATRASDAFNPEPVFSPPFT